MSKIGYNNTIMARPLRIEFKNAVYYITSKGNAENSIAIDDDDRVLFIDTLKFVIDRYKWKCHAYSLLDSLYALVVETPKPNLSRGMRQLNGIYTQKYNRKHGISGHVFQGRFKAIIVDKENYLLDICRHVVLLPYKSGISKSLNNYKWSSYRSTAGLIEAPDFLSPDWIYSQFAKRTENAQKKYKDYINEGKKAESPLNKVRGQILLGSNKFIQKLKPRLTEASSKSDIPNWQKHLNRPKINEIFKGIKNKTLKQRNRKIKEAHIKHGYTLKQIGEKLKLHYTSISRIINST